MIIQFSIKHFRVFHLLVILFYSSNGILIITHHDVKQRFINTYIQLIQLSYSVETMDNQFKCNMVSTMVHLTHSFLNVGKWCFTALADHGNSRSTIVMSDVALYPGSSPCLDTRLVTCSYGSIYLYVLVSYFILDIF